MTPESVINTEYRPQVAIWALGCTVYELITGTPMWEDADGDDVLDKIELEAVANLKSSSKVANTTKTRKKKIDSMSLLHKPIQKITFKISHHKLSRQLLDLKPLVHKQIQKITFKIGNHKFVRQFPDLKEIANETCGRVLGTDNR
ncbi:hypothetical protein MTR67_017799 [Solanum verrucosum]|uniref:Protein kinase domain-containing protein n=1 Tax=Solanum verrucosum TaxID=315347 RepID=A0AAF0TM56_SOLVR|nr:hypothetical protein MTR67_017799 [Solanum verrucosum]